MKATLVSVMKALVSGTGVLISLLVILIALTAVQAMSGQEQFVGLLLFFAVSFAIALGLAAASVAFLTRRHKTWPTAGAFAIGGALGGVLMAVALKAVDYFEQQLRALTHGGPIGIFLFVAILGAIAVAIFIGAVFSRWTRRLTTE